jgi:ribosome-associated protein
LYHGKQEISFIREQGNAARVLEDEQTQASGYPPWLTAVRAAESKKATDIRVLDLRELTSFADYFVICTGGNARQIQAISEEIGAQLAKRGEYPMNVEGFSAAEWVLADYGSYLVHVFSEKARTYYDLERLWRHARDVKIPE